MIPDDPENPAAAEEPEPSPEPAATPAMEAPARPRLIHIAPSRYLVTPSGPNDDRYVFDTIQSVLVCIRQRDGARRLHAYSAAPPPGHREIAGDALSYLTGAFPAAVPDDEELFEPIAG